MEFGITSVKALGKYEDGIMAGDLDSLLEMFEKAETSLSSTAADCMSLRNNDLFHEPKEENLTKHADQLSFSCGDVESVDCQSSNSIVQNENSGNDQHANGYENVNSSLPNNRISNRTFISNLERENSSENKSFEKRETILNSTVSLLNDTNVETLHKSKTRETVSETTSSSTIDGNGLKKDSSESSSDWDDDFPSDDKCSDSSSGPDTPCRGRGSTVRRDGPRRQQGRGRVKLSEEEKLYDRLPSYYTVFSRPNRMSTGIVRSSRSCLQVILKSKIPAHEHDSSPATDLSQVYDKVPAYQSCFTNSTRYDEGSDSHLNLDHDTECDISVDEGFRCGRERGSGSAYMHSRPRFRSRSRLRATMGPRARRAGRATSSAFDTSDATRPGSCLKSENSTQEQHRRILYIGCIPGTLTAERLKTTFEIFGPIEKCTVHLRECGDNYGFVTYVNTRDAYNAVEGGTQLPGCENFDICFGGRRNFCRANYFDLDGNVEMEEELAPVISKLKQKDDFDDLLMDELLKRKL